MLNIMEVNNSITRVINDNSEENLKEAISHLRRALCKHRYLGACDLQELHNTDIFLYTEVIGDFVPRSFHINCYHRGGDEPLLLTPNKIDTVMSIFAAYESTHQWCMHLLYNINDKPMFNKARHKK